MKNPYQVLGISSAAQDDEIKEAYIRMVKKYSPERDPERFKEIRSAYEAISTPRDRINYKLFFIEEEIDPQHLMGDLLNFRQRNRIPPKQLIEAIMKKYQRQKK